MKNSEGGLVRAIGLFGLTAAIVNVTVGGGIYRLPAAAAQGLGAAAPLAYVACAVALIFIVICFAEAGSRVEVWINQAGDMVAAPMRQAEIASRVELAQGLAAAGFAAGLGVSLIPSLGLANPDPGVIVRRVTRPEPIRVIQAAVREYTFDQPATRCLLDALRTAAN